MRNKFSTSLKRYPVVDRQFLIIFSLIDKLSSNRERYKGVPPRIEYTVKASSFEYLGKNSFASKYETGSQLSSAVFLPDKGFVESSIISSIVETSEPQSIRNTFFCFNTLSIAFWSMESKAGFELCR